METLEVQRAFKSRRSHTKSRRGCGYCRRRRIKCDEARPSCSQCISRNQACEYIDHLRYDYATRSDENLYSFAVADDQIRDAGSISTATATPSTSSLDRSTDFHNSNLSQLSSEQTCESVADATNDLASSLTRNLFLFDHYLNHACRNVDAISVYARKVGLPQLATKNQGVLCSVMALGAACLSIDLLQNQSTSSSIGDVEDLIKTGDRYHQVGLQTVQQQLVLNRLNEIEEAYAHSILLFPYALARKRIWDLLTNLDSTTLMVRTELYVKPLWSLDWTTFLRGISTTGRAYWAAQSTVPNGLIDHAYVSHIQNIDQSISSYILAKISEQGDHEDLSEPDFPYCIASKHMLFPVVNVTRAVALECLHRKLDYIGQTLREHHRKEIPVMDGNRMTIRLAQNQSLTACSIAVDLLVGLGKIIFQLEPVSDAIFLPMSSSTDTSPGNASLPWLQTYARRGKYDHTTPAYRTMFAWVSTTPNEYFDLLKEPVDMRKCHGTQQSHRNNSAPSWDFDRELRLVAWDIWAHWLVFAILFEHETFWAANLGASGITSLMPFFGSSVNSTPTSATVGKLDWWPANMCSIAVQLEKYHG